ncbi:MAG: hypothetical protein HWE27_10760 [Gammaproteobacteria bacterium]|nr:hypothetical protein [Gammaproteobacteria bacterium]
MIKLEINWAVNFLVAIIFYIITDFLSYYTLGALLSFVFFIGLLAVYCKNEVKGFHLLIYLLLLSPDHPRNLIEDLDLLKEAGDITYYSFITTKFAGVSLSVWSILIVGAIAFLRKVVKGNFKLPKIIVNIILIVLISLALALLSTFLDLTSRDVVDLKFMFSDFRIFLTLVLGVFIAVGYVGKNSAYVTDFMQLLVNISVIIGLKSIMFVASDLILASPKLMLSTQPYIFIALVFSYLVLDVKYKYLLLPLAILASVKISRGEIAYIMMEALLLIFVVALLYKNSLKKVTKVYSKNALVGLIVVALPVSWMALYNEYLFNFLVYKFSFFTTEIWSGDVAFSASTRMYEFLNIVAFQMENFRALIIGRGLGGYFDFTFFPLGYELGLSDFSSKELELGVFFKPHFFINFVLLKFGLTGLLLYSGLCLSLAYQGYRLASKSDGVKKLFGVYAIFLCIYSFNMFWQPILMLISAITLTFLFYENITRRNFEKRLSD